MPYPEKQQEVQGQHLEGNLDLYQENKGLSTDSRMNEASEKW